MNNPDHIIEYHISSNEIWNPQVRMIKKTTYNNITIQKQHAPNVIKSKSVNQGPQKHIYT